MKYIKYIEIKAVDYSGNISEPLSYKVIRDTRTFNLSDLGLSTKFNNKEVDSNNKIYLETMNKVDSKFDFSFIGNTNVDPSIYRLYKVNSDLSLTEINIDEKLYLKYLSIV